MDRVLVIAHRGGGALFPENTLGAFRRALAVGADGVEVDVRSTADGVLVALHDATLERTAGLSARLADMPWRVVREADAGARLGPEWAGERVPSLDQVLSAASRGHIVLDVKPEESARPGFTEDFRRSLRTHEGPLAVLSVDHAWLAELAARVPTILPLYNFRQPGDVARLQDLSAAVGLAVGTHALTPAMLTTAWAHDWPVYLWTPTAPAELEVALRLPVAAVISDDPVAALGIRARITPPAGER